MLLISTQQRGKLFQSALQAVAGLCMLTNNMQKYLYIYVCVSRVATCSIGGAFHASLTANYCNSTCKAVPGISPVNVSLLGLHSVLSLQM